MIKQIELHNFRSHRNTKLSFTEGNNILVGISGSGKSSVLDAICFAFFGTITKIQKKKIKLNDLVMSKPTKENESTVKLSFTSNEKNYEITRKIYMDKPTHAELRENGKLTAVGVQQVNSAIEQILKMNYDLFSNVIYAEQNQIDYFLNLPPGNRMTHIDELLKLEKFESIRSKSTRYANKFKNMETSKKETISTINEKELNENKTSLEKELENLKKDKYNLDKESKKIEKEIEKLEKIFKSLKEKKTKVEELKERLAKLNGLISYYDEEVKKSKELDLKKLKEDYETKKSKLEKKEQENLKIEKELSNINSKINELKKNLEEKKQAQEFLKKYDSKKLQELKTNLEKTQKTLFQKKILKQNLEEAINKLKQTKEKCPTCDQELTETKRKNLMKEKEEELNNIENELKKLEESTKEKNEKLKEEQSNFEKANYFERRLKELEGVEKDFEENKKKLSEDESKKEDLKDLKEEVEDLKDKYSKAKNLEEKKKNLEDCREQEKELKRKLEEIDFDENQLEKTRSQLESQKNKKTSLDKDWKYKLEIMDEKQKLFEQIKNNLEFLNKNKKEIEFLNYAQETLTKVSNNLVEIQENLREEFVKTLNEVMNEIWNDLYPYEDYIGIRFKIEERDYLLQLCDLKNKWVNVEGFSSGGERAIASLVMRIALSVILAPRLKIIILDEPTHNLDSNTINKLIDILKTRISNLTEQLFIVTHDERLTQAGTGYTYEFVRESSKKEPTKTNPLTI